MSKISTQSVLLILLAAGTIISGSANSLFTKLQDEQCVEDCNTTRPKNFEQPVLQTLQMFIGEFGVCGLVLLIARLIGKGINSSEPMYQPVSAPGLGPGSGGLSQLSFKNSFHLAIPAFCDIAGTTLLNLGLVFTPVSIYQMMRGSVVLFVAGASVIFLNKKISKIEWCALSTVTLGVAIVGFSGSHGSQGQTEGQSQSAGHDKFQVMIGIFLILVASCFTALQFVVEEFIIHKIVIRPLQLVSLEGIFGMCLTIVVMILGHLLIGQTPSGTQGPFDVVSGIAEMVHNKIILYTSFAIMISIGMFNFFGISITDQKSAAARSTIDTCRTLLVWIVSICVGWESFHFLQLFGFLLLVSGTLVFNGAIKPEQYLGNRLPKFLRDDDLSNDQRIITGIDEQIERL